MARKMKKTALTPEERLRAALVSEEEQPYPVPGNWCWTRIESVSARISDGSHNPPKNSGAGIPLLSAMNIHDNIIDIDNAVRWITENEWVSENERTQIEVGDVLVTIVATIGRTAVVQESKFALQRSVAVLKPKIDSKYLMYFIDSPAIQQYMNNNAKGTAQKGFYLNSLALMPVALAPLPEQQRIVARIESLFAKLDEAQEKVQASLDSFEPRKAAVLHRAFSGELTEGWRKEQGISAAWRNTCVKEICRDIKVGIVIKPSQYYTDAESGIPAFRSANVREFHVDNFDWVYINEKGQSSNTRSIVHTGDVLIVRSGNPGTACVVTDEFDGYNAIDILIAVPNKNDVTSEFLCAFTNSPIAKQQISEGKRGMALAHFNVGGYSKLLISIPSLDEQAEIVRILDAFFEQEAQAKAQAEAALEVIDTMKKSILAKAFRGELGTNDPGEESALELLKQSLNADR